MNNFEIITKLGQGSYSSVYKVKRKIDNQIYALKKVNFKTINEKDKNNALNEIRILASINSEYIIKYYEAFIDEKEETLNLVIEYADNGDLFEKIREKKNTFQHFSENEIWKTFIQITKALKILHDLNILHRDIKSANIFLFKNGNIKLGDMNVSKITKGGLGYTQTGTPSYASPEIWRDLPYDNKSDIWSLGCVIYEMCTLSLPFKGNNSEKLCREILKGDIQKIPKNYSEELFEIICSLLQIKANKRPSCIEILNNKIIKKKIEELKENNVDKEKIDNNNNEQSSLLKTIKMTENIFVTSNIKLPKAKYDLYRENTLLGNNLKSKNFLPAIKLVNNNYKSNIFNFNNYDLQLRSNKKIIESNHMKNYSDINSIEKNNDNDDNNDINKKYNNYKSCEKRYSIKKSPIKQSDDIFKIIRLYKERKSVGKRNEYDRNNEINFRAYTNIKVGRRNKLYFENLKLKLPLVKKIGSDDLFIKRNEN